MKSADLAVSVRKALLYLDQNSDSICFLCLAGKVDLLEPSDVLDFRAAMSAHLLPLKFVLQVGNCGSCKTTRGEVIRSL